jgi:hypothetical protein
MIVFANSHQRGYYILLELSIRMSAYKSTPPFLQKQLGLLLNRDTHVVPPTNHHSERANALNKTRAIKTLAVNQFSALPPSIHIVQNEGVFLTHGHHVSLITCSYTQGINLGYLINHGSQDKITLDLFSIVTPTY